jgi:hypothetical protein
MINVDLVCETLVLVARIRDLDLPVIVCIDELG